MENLTVVNLIDLIMKEKLTYKELNFINNELYSYSLKEDKFFSYSHDIKRIFEGTLWTFIIKYKEKNSVLVLLEQKKAVNGEEFLYVHLVSGDLKNTCGIQPFLNFFDNFLTSLAKERQLKFMMFNSRIGWDKFLKTMNFKKKYVTYVKEFK